MEQELLFEGIRALFIIAIPIVITAAVIGLLAAAFQTSTALRDPIISYALKVSAISVLLYFMLPQFIRTIVSLTEAALRI